MRGHPPNQNKIIGVPRTVERRATKVAAGDGFSKPFVYNGLHKITHQGFGTEIFPNHHHQIFLVFQVMEIWKYPVPYHTKFILRS